MAEGARLLLGVDGGNTKTIALLARADGTIVGTGRAGCSDIYNARSEAAALQELDRAVHAALAAAGAALTDIGTACFCLAGADWPEDFAFLRAALARQGHNAFDIANDALASLRAGTDDGVGVVLSCGTGFAAAARNAAGASWHSGFWSEPLGGAQLARDALLAVMRAELGIDPPTRLRQALLQHFGCADVEAIMRRFYGHATIPPADAEVARLAPAVLDAAAAGDGAAMAIVDGQGLRLAEYAGAAARQVGLTLSAAPLVLNGGLFRHAGSALQAALDRGFRQIGQTPAAIRRGREPAIGALLLAFDKSGQALSPQILSRLEASMPAADSLFRTAP